MDWREFLEKDAIDGKGGNDKIKPTKWINDPPQEEGTFKEIKISPKKHLKVARNRHMGDNEKIQVNDGKTTGLDDAHSNSNFDSIPKPRKGQYDMRRGDELGSVEHYKYRLRHGANMKRSNLDVDLKNNKVLSHEGRHGARAAMEEGHKKIPVNLLNDRFDDENNKKRDLKGLKYEEDLTESSKELPKTGGKDTRHPIFGRKKAWEDWLKKETQPTGLTGKKLALWKKIQEDNKEDSDNQYYTKAWEEWLEKGDDDEYHNVMSESTKERKGSRYDKDSKTWFNPVGMPTASHCGATSSVLARRGHGTRVEGQYHATWNKKPENHSWVENKDGHIIDASRDQFHGAGEKGIKTIKHDHPNYKDYKKNPACKDCGSTSPKEHYSNLHSKCTGKNCGKISDDAANMFKQVHGREHKNRAELAGFRKVAEKQIINRHGLKKSWELFLEKNNAIETDHKEGEKKHEWDGKFSSSTIRDDAENDDDKAVSEEESLEELTDGDLVEIEKLKSWESWLEIKKRKDIAAKRVNPEEMPQKEAHHTFSPEDGWNGRSASGQHTVRGKNPKTSVRRMIDGVMQKVPSGISVSREGNEKESTKGRVINARNASPTTVSNAQRLITSENTARDDSDPKKLDNAIAVGRNVGVSSWDKNINDGDQGTSDTGSDTSQTLDTTSNPENTQEVKDNKFINDEASKFRNSEVGKKQAARRAKREAAKKKLARKSASWESWLEKKNRTINDDFPKGKPPHIDYNKEPDKTIPQIKRDFIDEDADDKEYKNASWESWLEKNDDVDKIITDLARRIKDPEQREDIIQRQANQKVKETVEKGVKHKERNVGVRAEQPYAEARNAEEIMESAKNPDTIITLDADMKKSWEGWLEKMQGAGDARFGNQHLTGLDQKPVNNEEDEANILPEKDEKRDEKEEKDDKDGNKPYKLLSED